MRSRMRSGTTDWRCRHLPTASGTRSTVKGRTNMHQTTYHRPATVDEAVALFAKGSDAKYLAGGHTLLPVMKQRLASPSDVIDIGRIKELIGIQGTGDTLSIRGATT